MWVYNGHLLSNLIVPKTRARSLANIVYNAGVINYSSMTLSAELVTLTAALMDSNHPF